MDKLRAGKNKNTEGHHILRHPDGNPVVDVSLTQSGDIMVWSEDSNKERAHELIQLFSIKNIVDNYIELSDLEEEGKSNEQQTEDKARLSTMAKILKEQAEKIEQALAAYNLKYSKK